jgi:hypothetical protein
VTTTPNAKAAMMPSQTTACGSPVSPCGRLDGLELAVAADEGEAKVNV